MIDSERTTGVVFDLQRWSIHDGPGARTVVFLKGCPLRCEWCCNPESQAREPQVAFSAGRCIGCGRCTPACPTGALRPDGADRARCAECGQCVDACPSGARHRQGRPMTVAETMRMIERDMRFYRRSGGGATLSGGEPLGQPAFARDLLAACRSLAIHTAVETCGHFDWKAAQDAVAAADLVFLDLKHMDPGSHRRWMGVSNELILRNAPHIARAARSVIVRIPIVPSLNDTVENVRSTADFVRREMPGVVGMELLPYHALGKSKYESLGLTYRLEHVQPPDGARLALLRDAVREFGVPVVDAAGAGV